MTAGFTTIGHSTRPLSEFEEMLSAAQVNLVVDVRSYPRSRTNPIYNIDCLPDSLKKIHVAYTHAPALGGRRPKQRGIDPNLNGVWREPSFHNYADYALSAQFGAAFRELVLLGTEHRLAIMCSEAVWWKCHRRIITDYLLLNGHEVVHLLVPDGGDPATPTPGAQRTQDSRVIYPTPEANEAGFATHTP
jgi:uncharacterized protein (DUF488 family)